ncbi:3-deoxy-D-manno-octulosonic acid transferase [Methylophilaceae bacterium]|mgnify:FL=1|nr:3-deoxy-D-manno-octulosonic acid transferase [Methylophilaceae bacterium]
MRLIIYNIIVYLVLPLTIIKLVYRGIKNKDYLRGWTERFAIYPHSEKNKWIKRKTLWIHCVSVGETKAIYRLLEQLQEKHSQAHFLITNGTPTGKKVALPKNRNIHRAYLPYDAFGLVKRFLNFYKPTVGILIEKEIWPNLITQCNYKKIPLLLINGRLSNESINNYIKFRNFYTPLLNKLSDIYVQSESDKKNFEQLTTHKVQVIGNLKFDQIPPKETMRNSKKLRDDLMINNQIVIVAGSTREGEEEIILNQILKIYKKNITLILTPRHPERFSKVENLLKSKNLKFAKRSKVSSIKSTPNFILGDSMDEMYIYYEMANIVILGGSFFNYGSQNPIEPIKMKKPTIIGPSIFNFKDIILDAIKSKAAIQINHIHDLPKTITKLSHLKTQNSMIQRSKKFISRSEGSSSKALKFINQYF